MNDLGGLEIEGAPWWANFILRIGLTGAICLGMIYLLGYQVANDLRDVTTDLRAVLANQTTHSSEIVQKENLLLDTMQQHAVDSARLGNILIAMCLNESHLGEERQRCLNFMGPTR